MKNFPLVRQFAVVFGVVAAFAGCSKKNDVPPGSTSLTELPIGTGISVVTATPAECPTGGLVVQTFLDKNRNGLLDSDETVLARSPVCNGEKGDRGVGAGVSVVAASAGACPAGGTVISTYPDYDNDGVQDVDEGTTSVSTICNGVSSVLTSVAANGMQCPAGGTVYTTHVDGQAPSSAIVCNGVAGVDGSDAGIKISAVGPAVPGRSFTACHHDALYIPDAASGRGWLIFRHQANGSADQGIGTTGFNTWNVDIADFALVSENLAVTYCSLHWNPAAKKLDFTVVENTYGQGGQTGSVQF
ncbi:MAG: hypothetical protein JST04_11775 [Bdellovibrionales bacterium]|nr:hypothetical protein [Bdellovibrionales bacterium]